MGLSLAIAKRRKCKAGRPGRVEPLFLRWNKLILGLFISTYLYPHIYPLHNSWSRNFQMGTILSGRSLAYPYCRRLPWERTPTYLYPHIYPLPTHGRAIFKWVLSGRSLDYPYCRRLPWERTGRRLLFFACWLIGGKGLGHWWETHLFPLISHRIRFSVSANERRKAKG